MSLRLNILNSIISQTNSDIESVTLENFNDMTEDELSSIMLIGNERVRHAYRPETLYSQYVSARGIIRDPQNLSYTLSRSEVEEVFNRMRMRYPNFQPQEFNNEEIHHEEGDNLKRLINNDDERRLNNINEDEDEVPVYQRDTSSRGFHVGSQRQHSLLSSRNSYLDDLERDFNDMVNRRDTGNNHHVKEKRPYNYDFEGGKGPGGFPMRGGDSSNVSMPAQEPLFEPHKILLYDPDHRYTPTKNQIHTLAYTYKFNPYGTNNTEVFSPGNSKPDQIQSEKMPEWMTVDPMKRDKVSFIEDINKEEKRDNVVREERIEERSQSFVRPPEQKKEKVKLWWVIVPVILYFFLHKKVKLRRY